MKKFFPVMLLAVALIFISGQTNQTEAATPARDTWVLTWDGANYYVKAGSLNQSNAGYDDVAPEFTCRVAHNGIVRNYEFAARGYAVLYVDGQKYGDSRNSRFVDAMYNAICDIVIYHRR